MVHTISFGSPKPSPKSSVENLSKLRRSPSQDTAYWTERAKENPETYAVEAFTKKGKGKELNPEGQKFVDTLEANKATNLPKHLAALYALADKDRGVRALKPLAGKAVSGSV